MLLNRRNGIATLTLAACLIPVGMWAQHAATAYTGVVSDDMCGVTHTMDPGHTAAECTRMCVKDGASYALVVGKKAYTLATTNKQELATLDKYAGQRVVVKGTLKGDTLAVSTVAPARAK